MAETKEMKIIIVEDDPIIRFTMVKMLKKHYSNVDSAENGKQALEMIGSENYDVIVTDLQMPVMDGYELVRELRKRKNDTPIIICSAYSFEEKEKYKCEWLSKPIMVKNLIELIDTCAA